MKNSTTFFAALVALSLSNPASIVLADGDGASQSSKNPIQKSGKQVVVEKNSGKRVMVEHSTGKQVVEKNSGKQVVVDPTSGGTVAGRVFDDTNGDGKKGSDESYLANVKVRLQDSEDEVVASTITEVQGIYVFKDVADGQYRLEFDFGESKQIYSQPFAVNYDRPSVIVEPVPYFAGFDFDLVPPIRVHKVYTAAELKGERPPPTSSQSPTSPFRP